MFLQYDKPSENLKNKSRVVAFLQYDKSKNLKNRQGLLRTRISDLSGCYSLFERLLNVHISRSCRDFRMIVCIQTAYINIY